jgi:carboxyl-terminal processing protease
MRRYRSLSAAVFAVVVSALVGGFFGKSALATQDRVPDQYKLFTSALTAIENNYVVPVESDRLVYSAISGMLQTLDPHSSFMDPKSYAQMRERQEGRYYGLGVSISVVDGDITVVQLFEGSPASLKGMRRGDVIARIEGEDTKGWTTDQAVRRLKGPKGTTVSISIRRPGYDSLIPLQVQRDEIHINTVKAEFMLDSSTGYLQLAEFAENSNQEVGRALADLTSKGMHRLVFDIRENPGGPLDQAIKIANRFLPKGDLIVYTRGRVSNSDQDYRATEQSDYTNVPMIVLTNRDSASASEIVSGALQDHDRALIVGETTFGKALVQSVYRISQGAGLAVTTAHYYTPSGRLIQRPWDESFDEYLSYRQREQDANKVHNAADLKLTDGGRKVYSGGGIEPDRRFDGPVEGFNPTRFGRQLYSRQLFDGFAQRFSRKGDTRVAPSTAKDRHEVAPNFVVDDALMQEFRDYVVRQKMQIDEASWQKDLDFIRAMVRYEIDLDVFGFADAKRHLTDVDPQMKFAVTLFPEAQKLSELSKLTGRKAQR